MKIEVGQVWEVDGGLVMVSSPPKGDSVMAGKAQRRGSAYAMTGTPAAVKCGVLLGGRFIADTECEEVGR